MTRARTLSRLANATVLTVDGSNNVGIGSTIPDAKLDVIGIVSATTFTGNLTGNASGLSGSPNITINNLVGVAATFSGVVTYEDVTNIDSVGIITAQSYVSIADSIVHTGDTNTAIRFPSADTFTVETAGDERLRIDSSGNMGVGTTPNADSQLHVKSGANDNNPILRLEGATNNFLNFRQTGSVYDIHVTASDPLSFSIGASERMRIDSSGKVGIGTLSPATKFVVSNSGAEGLEFGHTSGTNEVSSYNRSTSARAPVDIIGKTFKVLTGDPSLSTGLFQDSSGNVGIGTTAPGAKLDVNGTIRRSNGAGNYTDLVVQGSGGSFIDSSHFFQFRTNGDSSSQAMRIDSSGKVGIGTALPDESLEVAGNGLKISGQTSSVTDEGLTFDWQSAGNNGRIFSESVGSSNLLFYTTNSGSRDERMRIDSSGNWLGGGMTSLTVGASTKGWNFADQGDHGRISLVADNTTTTAYAACFYHGGNYVGNIATTSSTTTYYSASDYRLKENVVDIADGITRVKQLAPKRFNFIADDTKVVDGFLAHEAQTVVPEAISGTHNEVDDDENPVYQGIDQSKLVPLLTAALQEAITKIETLETKVAALEAA